MYEHDTVVRHWYDKADFEVRHGCGRVLRRDCKR